MAVNKSPFSIRLNRAISFNVPLDKTFGFKQFKFKSNTIANSTSQFFHFDFNKRIRSDFESNQIYTSIRLFILLMYHDQVFYQQIILQLYFLVYASNSLFTLVEHLARVQVSPSCFPFWTLIIIIFFFTLKILSFSYQMYLTHYWLFALVCSFSIKYVLNEYLKQNNNEKAKTTITTTKIGKEHHFKNQDAYCIAHNVARKKPDVLFANARHVTLKGSPWRLSFPNPLPTGSKLLR